MIAFTVSLVENDWDKNLGGWRCSVLRIPGAEVQGLYAGTKVDDAWYQVDRDQGLVRWSRSEEPPKSAALGIHLTEELASRRQRDFWKAFAIVVPVLTALITTTGTVMVQRMKARAEPAVTTLPSEPTAAGSKPAGQSFYEKWTVQGRVLIRGGDARPYHVQAKIFPPELPLNEMGKFTAVIPVMNSGNDVREFPSITFESRLPGYEPVTVELGEDKDAKRQPASAPGGAYRPPEFDQRFDFPKKRITITSNIELVKHAQPYDPKKAEDAQRQ
ncbi:MAG TPA: hypothetical protein VGJ35_07625 [Burkholderiaceae bacterium]